MNLVSPKSIVNSFLTAYPLGNEAGRVPAIGANTRGTFFDGTLMSAVNAEEITLFLSDAFKFSDAVRQSIGRSPCEFCLITGGLGGRWPTQENGFFDLLQARYRSAGKCMFDVSSFSPLAVDFAFHSELLVHTVLKARGVPHTLDPNSFAVGEVLRAYAELSASEKVEVFSQWMHLTEQERAQSLPAAELALG